MRRRARMVNAWTTSHAGWVLILLALVSVFQLSYFSWHNREVSNCQNEYNQALAVSLKTRSQYSDRDRDSLVKFIRTIAQAKSQKQSRSALDTYLNEQSAIESERNQHPIPDVPTGGRC